MRAGKMLSDYCDILNAPVIIIKILIMLFLLKGRNAYDRST